MINLQIVRIMRGRLIGGNMARKLRPSEIPHDLGSLLGRSLVSADMQNLPLTAAHIAMAFDIFQAERARSAAVEAAAKPAALVQPAASADVQPE